MCDISAELLRNIVTTTNQPLVLREFVKNWPSCQWDASKWCSIFGEKVIPFRTMRKYFVSDEPCWERKCGVKMMVFKDFIEKLSSSKEWMYFDYKYLHQWFSSDHELYKEISWAQFGFPEKGPKDTTLWIGSAGAHTPAHQDTYGYNIVAQLHGIKRWILLPPETGGMKPTRVPYEESSIYSELNFYCPENLEPFKGVTGARCVELQAGDALVVPRGWWHYVQNLAPLNIALNIWLPHEKDPSTQVSEALIKILIAQVCKDLPQETAKLIMNPNEDDLADTPLAVLFLQLDTVVKTYLDAKRKTRRVKRQKTCDDDSTTNTSENVDITTLLGPKNKIELLQPVTNEKLIDIMKSNLEEFVNASNDKASNEDETDGGISSLCLTKALINAFTERNVIEAVKQNLISRLS